MSHFLLCLLPYDNGLVFLNTNTDCYFQGCHGSIEKSSSGRITLGEQAAALVNPHDRVMALRRVTAAAQVLLARTMVMRALSLLSVRFVASLATFLPFHLESVMKLCLIRMQF